ncbi:MAG: ATP-dependent metallopeptidase FtsH/Yme1/Tma family protein [Ignavibacteriae bacterium]|nr:ATP-dependent metallopeptidase FtsH/Yme1/Tma family protein [Ignavibacteriota bacterium]
MSSTKENEKRTQTPPLATLRMPPMMRWFLVALAVLIGIEFIYHWSTQGQSIPYSTFKQFVTEGKIAKVEIDGQSLSATARGTDEKDAAKSTTYTVTIPSSVPDNALMQLLEEKKVTVTAVQDASAFWNTIIWFVLPLGIMLAFFFVFNARMRAQGGGGGGLLSMGKMNAQLYSKEKVKTTFADVAGSKEQKEALFEIIHFLKRPQDFKKLGGSSPKGVLLVGPPGTGKTLLARAVAGEADVPFYHVAGSAFLEMLVGVGASRVRDLFATAKKNTPCIIFVDEIDSIGRRRGGIQGFYGGGASEMEQTLNQLLSEMDGFESNEDVIVMAATNQPEVLDPALLRPGRFDRRISVDLPNLSEREEILAVHVRKVPLAPEVELRALARATPGNSGADLKNLVNEAAIYASKKRKDQVEMEDFWAALDTIMLGQVRSSLILSEEEKRRTAFHEAGHALTAISLPGSDPVTKVTIVPRGRALGVTMQTPLDERHNYTREYLLDRLVVLLGGRAAEQLVFASISTGAESDLMHCTTLARNMVARYGMSDTVGNISLMEPGADSYLGNNPFSQRNFSEETMRLIDAETRRFIDEAYERALELLRSRRAQLDAVAEALVTKEIIDGTQLNEIMTSVQAG